MQLCNASLLSIGLGLSAEITFCWVSLIWPTSDLFVYIQLLYLMRVFLSLLKRKKKKKVWRRRIKAIFFILTVF